MNSMSPAAIEREAAVARLEMHYYESLKLPFGSPDEVESVFRLIGKYARLKYRLEENSRAAIAMECEKADVIQQRAETAVEIALQHQERLGLDETEAGLNYIAETPYVAFQDDLGRELADMFYVAIRNELSAQSKGQYK